MSGEGEIPGARRENVDPAWSAKAHHRHGQWTGLFKLIEECGEAMQVAGKIAAFPDADEHPDGEGSLRGRIECELADLIASAEHVIDATGLDAERIRQRIARKRALFQRWMTI